MTANREITDLEVNDLKHVKSENGYHLFKGDAKCSTPGNRGYVVRVVPYHEDVRVPSETELVAWEPVD